MKVDPFQKPSWVRAYSFTLFMVTLFLISWFGQLLFQITVVTNEAWDHGSTFSWDDFWPQFLASTFENWQSEFLQLGFQAAGLAVFYRWGSSQSREQTDRIEAKLDRLLSTDRGDRFDR